MTHPAEHLMIEQHANGVLSITLNRPNQLNALNHQLLSELKETLQVAAATPAIKALLITGSGKAFCAGADIHELAELNSEAGYRFAKQGQAIFTQLETLGKPSVAAINGFAFGGGCELAMAASIRVASEKAQFGQPEVKLGVIPGYGGTQRLARLVGKGRALDLCLTGRFIGASEALEWGLVTHCVAPDALLSTANTVLSQLLAQAPIALSSVLETLHGGYNLSLEEAFELEALHFARTCATVDKTIGVNAFLNKQPPVFEGQ